MGPLPCEADSQPTSKPCAVSVFRQLFVRMLLTRCYGCLQVKGIADAGLKPRKMKKIAVLGGGLMGSGIATASALAGMDVIIKEVNDKFLQVWHLRDLLCDALSFLTNSSWKTCHDFAMRTSEGMMIPILGCSWMDSTYL